MNEKNNNCIILYKDKHYKICNVKKLSKINLSYKNIKIIFIPVGYQNSLYIPIKPSSLYNFIYADIQIEYGIGSIYIEDTINIENNFDYISENSISNTHVTVNNLVDLINNLQIMYNYRAFSILYNESMEFDYYDNYSCIYTKYFKIDFYDKNGQIFYTIESDRLPSIKNLYKKYNKYPMQYWFTDFFYPLRKILFIPEEMMDLSANIILKSSDLSWKNAKRLSDSDNINSDVILVRMRDWNTYKCISISDYVRLLDIKPTVFNFESIPYNEKSDHYIPYILDKEFINKILTNSQKMEILKILADSDMLYNNISLRLDCVSIIDFLIFSTYFYHIFLYNKYISYEIYGSNIFTDKITDHTTMINFILIYPTSYSLQVSLDHTTLLLKSDLYLNDEDDVLKYIASVAYRSE